MKDLSIFVIVDIVSKTILTVFSAISEEMAYRQYSQALEANKDKIYDLKDIVLMRSKDDGVMTDCYSYFVPETYEEVLKDFIPVQKYTCKKKSKKVDSEQIESEDLPF